MTHTGESRVARDETAGRFHIRVPGGQVDIKCERFALALAMVQLTCLKFCVFDRDSPLNTSTYNIIIR